MNPYQVVKDFEIALAKYTGAPYAVSIDSGTNALLLCCEYLKVKEVYIPSKTYPSVPCAIIHAGGKVKFDSSKNNWHGLYKLNPYPIYDSAKRFTKNMYISNSYMCLSFHGKKILNIGRGGAILTNNKDAVNWFKMARFDGRHEKPLAEDSFTIIGHNCYMTPELAARGLLLLSYLPGCNDDLPKEDYPDLEKMKIYE